MTPRIKSPTTPAVASAELADQINAAHAACNQAARDALCHALAAGDLLTEAKATCRPGEWQAWLADNFAGSARTARAYLRLAAHREQLETKTADAAVLSIDGALRLLASPRSDGGTRLAELEATIEEGLAAAQDVYRALGEIAQATRQDVRAVAAERGIAPQSQLGDLLDVWQEFQDATAAD